MFIITENYQKLTLARTPDPIRPTKWGPNPNRPTRRGIFLKLALARTPNLNS